ncbi:MAG: hypothetical protein K8F52_15180 [Candidatus Scalindua rubra]|uniref:Uncharacterized protein n=1 Tax=Candidatus Scalindua brodae TaxID=237368 RepID=A0A0B0ES18_9BACT|nr:MAG: hypothetical protein SCABRO_00765 [Candidatus Scalindua brodae]MBZ0109994.1 hypothetical protein [Candidatus Scalindua rubra]
MKRSVLIFLVFSAISLVATLLPKYLDRNKFLQGIKSVRSEQKQDAKSGLNDPGNGNDSMLLFMRREVEEIERLKSSPGIESDVVLDSVLKIAKEMISVYSENESAMIKVFKALESNTINTPEDIVNSIEMARQSEIAANRMERLNNEMGTQLKESLGGSRELSSDIDSTVRGFYLTADIERRSELYKMNAEVMKEARLVLQILEKEWGAWEYNAEEGGVLFESESAVIEFNNTMAQLGVLVRKVKELQLTVLKTRKGYSG